MNNPSEKMYFRRDLNHCFFLLQISTLIIKTIIIIKKTCGITTVNNKFFLYKKTYQEKKLCAM
jgi:hypothetical protein